MSAVIPNLTAKDLAAHPGSRQKQITAPAAFTINHSGDGRGPGSYVTNFTAYISQSVDPIRTYLSISYHISNIDWNNDHGRPVSDTSITGFLKSNGVNIPDPSFTWGAGRYHCWYPSGKNIPYTWPIEDFYDIIDELHLEVSPITGPIGPC